MHDGALPPGPGNVRLRAPGWLRSEIRRALDRISAASRQTLITELAMIVVVVGTSVLAAVTGDSASLAADAVLIAALPARHVWPSVSLLALAVVPGASTLTATLITPFVAFGAGRNIGRLRRKIAVFVVAVLAAGWFDVARTVQSQGWEQMWHVFALNASAAGLLLGVPGAIGAVVAERQSRVGVARERAVYYQQAHRLGDTQARLQERARIATEMHDLLGHRLSLMTVYAGALELRTAKDAPEVSKEATLLRTTAKTALDELREVLGILRLDPDEAPDGGPPEDQTGTRADIGRLVEASRAAGVAVDLSWSGADLAGIDQRVRRAVHRVVRESLTNVHKHAAGATARVIVDRGDHRVRVEIHNDAADPGGDRLPGTGLGLVGLEERVRLAGGAFASGPGAGGAGFGVIADLPLADSPDREQPQASPGLPYYAPGFVPPGAPAWYVRDRVPQVPVPKSRSLRNIVLLGLCLPAVIVAAVITVLVVWSDDLEISPYEFGAVKIGQPRADVEAFVGDGNGYAADTARGEEPPKPAESRCIYFLSSEVQAMNRDLVYRFCFAGGKLVEKKEFLVKSL